MPQPGGCITARTGTRRCATPHCGARTATMGGRRACLPGGRPGSAAASARDSDNRRERVGDRVVVRGRHVPRGWEVVVLGVSAEGCVAESAGRRGGSSEQPMAAAAQLAVRYQRLWVVAWTNVCGWGWLPRVPKKIAPVTVTATTLPSWVMVLTTPEAGPARRAGTCPSTMSASAPEMVPKAIPVSARLGASCQVCRAVS
jgi:hypothetical protein